MSQTSLWVQVESLSEPSSKLMENKRRIPNRKKEEGGSFFGIIKFSCVRDMLALEKSLQRLICGHNILQVNISKYDRQNGRKTCTREEALNKTKGHTHPAYETSCHNAWRDR